MMNDEVHLRLMSVIEKNPSITQRELSKELGVSLGKVNYCLKALKEKGWVKWGNFSKNPNKAQYAHLLTPRGVSQKMALTLNFLKRKQAEYDRLKLEIEMLTQVVAESEVSVEIGN